MGYYSEYVLPRVVHFLCSQEPIARQRGKVVALARGRVLEIGVGSGLNLPFYDPVNVEHVWGLDPSMAMWKLRRNNGRRNGFGVEFIQASAESIPLGAHSADTVMVTYSLCTIPDVPRALGEMRRVLKQDGRLLFCEHGAAREPSVQRWQNRLNPLWKVIGGGCNLNRRIPVLLERSGFEIEAIDTEYMPGWRPVSFIYRGSARLSG